MVLWWIGNVVLLVVVLPVVIFLLNRVLAAVNEALKQQGGQGAVGLVCVRPGQRVRAGAVLESASRSLRPGRPGRRGQDVGGGG